MRVSKYKNNRIMAGINITPFTDVVLVLLVIFMIATPLIIQSSLKVNLPKASGTQQNPPKSIIITVDAKGVAYLEDKRVSLADLKAKLTPQLAAQPATPVVIMGDKDVRYDFVIQVLDLAKSCGAQKLSLGAEQKKTP